MKAHEKKAHKSGKYKQALLNEPIRTIRNDTRYKEQQASEEKNSEVW